MRKTGKFLLGGYATLVAGVVLWSSAGAQQKAGIRVEGLIERPQVGVGEEFNFQVAVVSSEDVANDEPKVPELDGLRIVNVSSSSATSSQMRMGARGWEIESSRRMEYDYSMVALRKGTLTIPPFSVRVEGETYRTKPVTLVVVDQPQGQGQAQRQRGGGFPGFPGAGRGQVPIDDLLDDPDELFRQLMQRQMGRGGALGGGGGGMQNPAHNTLPTNPNEVLFIQTEVDKKEVYEGEQVTVNWYILVRGNLLSLDRTKFPDLRGFWKEIIEEVPALQFGQEVINGQVYRKALLASHALFPIKPGTFYIDEYKIKGRVLSGGSPFGGGSEFSFTRSSDRVPIKVLPLPKEGRPADFSGAVGQFNVQAQLDNNVVPANQPMTLKIRFEGSGNAKLIEMPTINWPPGLEMVEVKSESRFFKNGQSFKQFDFILIPHQVGDLQTPAISVGLFDPEKKAYYTRTLEPLSLKVIPGAPGAPMASSRVRETKPQAPAAPSLPPPILEASSSAGLFQGAMGWGLVLGAYGFTLLVLAGRAFQVFSGRAQRKDLYKVLHHKIRRAETAAAKDDYRGASVQMINLFAEILGDLSGQGGSHREIEKMLELGPPSLRRLYGEEILRQLQDFQSLSFAPEEMLKTGKTPAELKKRITEAQKLLKSLIDSIKPEQG